jgi:tetratricopeptide (TPR) repeat protein
MLSFNRNTRLGRAPRVPLLIITLSVLCFMLLTSACAAQDATDYATHFNHGQDLMRQMRYHEATAEFLGAVHLNPDYVPAQQALTLAYVFDNNLPMAWKQIFLLRQLKIALPDDFVQHLSSLLPEAEAGKQLTEIEENVEAKRKAAAEHPDNPGAQAALGTALGAAGDYSAAQHTAERALALDPAQPEAHLLLGSMLGGEPPNSERAIPHLKLYLQNVPRTPENAKDVAHTYWILGDLYRRSGREQEALQTYEEGLETAPDEASMLNNAAWTYATAQDTSLRNPQKALIYARKAVGLSKGEKATFLDTLAEALYANSQFEEAVTMEEKALVFEPKSEIYRDQLRKFQVAQKQAKQPAL